MVSNIFNNLKIQKNRFKCKSKKTSIKFGDSAVICKNEGKFELIHISKIKKIIKKFIRKKRNEKDITREKIWYFGTPNFFIQKKSKNSRMGKGKGLIDRKIIRVKKNFIIFEFLGVSFKKLLKFVVFCNKFLNVKLSVILKKKKNFVLWSKYNNFFIFYDKYLTS